MQLTGRPLEDVEQTGSEMVRLVRSYHGDIGDWAARPLRAFFRHIAELPYIADPDEGEAISRPKYCLSAAAEFRDCDDKAICIAAWLFANKMPFRFLACSYKEHDEPHHVITETVDSDGREYVIDPTYPGARWPADKDVYFNCMEITPWVVP